MSMFNRRYAVIGWLAWVGAKTAMKRKARQAVPGTVEGSRRPNKGAIAAGLAALGGALWFWRRKSSTSDELSPES
jgi:LPXTG-motif cell wall-anchored protein